MGSQEPIRYQELAPRLPEGELDLPSLVPGAGPLELDIGFGRGLSLLERAQQGPDARLLGIETKAKYAYKVDQRCRRLGLEQVRVFAGDARDLLSRGGPDGCVRHVFVHFPDPWWKKRHAKRRMIGPQFVDSVARILSPGGQLFIQTDVQERAEGYLELVREHGAFTLEGPGGFIETNPFGARSNRERRAEEDGLPVWRLLGTRT